MVRIEPATTGSRVRRANHCATLSLLSQLLMLLSTSCAYNTIKWSKNRSFSNKLHRYFFFFLRTKIIIVLRDERSTLVVPFNPMVSDYRFNVQGLASHVTPQHKGKEGVFCAQRCVKIIELVLMVFRSLLIIVVAGNTVLIGRFLSLFLFHYLSLSFSLSLPLAVCLSVCVSLSPPLSLSLPLLSIYLSMNLSIYLSLP